jgi:acrylyl-CoA reductase (NADPH)
MPEFTAVRVFMEQGRAVRRLQQRHTDQLPPGEVLIQVHYSSLNYKDALSACGHTGVTRHYPHTPGIDAAGIVVHSDVAAWQVGTEVLVSGYDLGMNTDGGFSGYVRVPAAWVMVRPAALSLHECMIYGTAGFTAALCIEKLHYMGITPDQGDILVTGATGGVGCMSVALLAHLGYNVIALSGKSSASDWLYQIGAHDILVRQELDHDSKRPLLKARWAGVIDTVGGAILAYALRSAKPHAAITACGLTAGTEVPLSVYPFILRGITLLGVDAATTPMPQRHALWQKLATSWKPTVLPQLQHAIADLAQLERVYIDKILHGSMQGRLVVDCKETGHTRQLKP